jgi:MFS family permease
MTHDRTDLAAAAVRARLRPLHVAVALHGLMLWVPVEKLFLSEIGFTPASIGLMAAAYAVVTPLLEVPSGILADRWSRRGVLVLATVALLCATLIGGLSHSVPMYVVSAMLLGVYFAMYSGTVESIVYDLVLEETGTGSDYQRLVGRVRLTESAALVASALAGGVIADLTSPRFTYFMTLPFTALAIAAYLRFSEPQLHREGVRESLRDHVAVTLRTITSRGELLPVVLVGALTLLIQQVVFEFGPLWLVAFAAPAFLFGPYWAGLVGTLGVGGVLAGVIRLDRPATSTVFAALMITAGALLSISSDLVVVISSQIALALLVSVASIHVSALLHDAVPSTIRAGVASGVSTLSWVGFLPFALVLGWVTKEYGVDAAGWMVTATTVIAGALLVRLSTGRRIAVTGDAVVVT